MILRMPAVKAETAQVPASITTLSSGPFTDPVKIGERSVGWPDDEVKAICAARIAWTTKSGELVNRLHAKARRTPAPDDLSNWHTIDTKKKKPTGSANNPAGHTDSASLLGAVFTIRPS